MTTTQVGIVAAISSLLIGLAMGYGIRAAKKVEPEKVEVIEYVESELSEEELLALCTEPVKEERHNLQASQDKVLDLQSQLEAREAELAEIRKKAKKSKSRSSPSPTEMERDGGAPRSEGSRNSQPRRKISRRRKRTG